MRAVVLAGGYAKRLWPITRDFPKPLLPINGRPAIDYIVDKLLEIDVARIFVSTNLKFEKQFQTWLGEKPPDKIEIVAERSTSENQKPGATHALAELTHQLPHDDYVIVAGDNIFTDSLEGMVTFYSRVRKSVVAIFDAEDSDQVRRGSTVSLDQDMRILSFEEKPTHPTCYRTRPFCEQRNISVREEEAMSPAILSHGFAKKKPSTDFDLKKASGT